MRRTTLSRGLVRVRILDDNVGMSSAPAAGGSGGSAGDGGASSVTRMAGSLSDITDRRTAELRLQPEQGIRSADDIFVAVAEGKAYVEVTSIGNPATEIRGQLTKRN